MKPKFKVGNRVKFTKKPFLPHGKIIKAAEKFGFACYIVKLDEKAPDDYAYGASQVLAFPDEIEKE